MERYAHSGDYYEYCQKLRYMSTAEIESDCRKLVADIQRESEAAESIDAKNRKYYDEHDYKPSSRDLSAALVDHVYKGGNFETIQALLSQFEQKTRAYLDMLLFESDHHTFIVQPSGKHAGMRGEQWLIECAHDIKLIHKFQTNAVSLICAIRKELDHRIRKRIKESLKGHEQHMRTHHQCVDQAVQHNVDQK